MNKSLQSYTPTAHPLNYDSLAQWEGCEADSGVDILGALAFTNVCIFRHNPTSSIFNQLDTVSYAYGPNATGEPVPHTSVWTAWQSKVGIRVGKVGIVVPPSPTLGVPSTIYPEVQAIKVTHAFDSRGIGVIAVEKAGSPGFIELKAYQALSGARFFLKRNFTGKSPVLFNLGLVDPGSAGVACFYLRSDRPFKLFIRFAVELYDVEHELMPDLRTNLSRIIRITNIQNVVKLYGINDQGKDVTLTSPPYAVQVRDQARVTAALLSGLMFKITTAPVAVSSKARLTASLISGSMFDATAETESIATEKATSSTLLESGEMIPH